MRQSLDINRLRAGFGNRSPFSIVAGLAVMAVFAAAAILVHLVRRFALRASLEIYTIPFLVALVLGSMPLVYQLARNLYGDNSTPVSSPEVPSLLLFFSMNTSTVHSYVSC